LADLEWQGKKRTAHARSGSQSHACLPGRMQSPNDAKRRYRAGLRVGTSMTEGTANFLVNRRMNKGQRMRWSRKGADMLLQVRCAVSNGAFEDGFSTLFDPTSNTVQKLPLAA
jgi:hypothetical protein